MENYNDEMLEQENPQKDEAYVVENELRKTMQRQFSDWQSETEYGK